MAHTSYILINDYGDQVTISAKIFAACDVLGEIYHECRLVDNLIPVNNLTHREMKIISRFDDLANLSFHDLKMMAIIAEFVHYDGLETIIVAAVAAMIKEAHLLVYEIREFSNKRIKRTFIPSSIIDRFRYHFAKSVPFLFWAKDCPVAADFAQIMTMSQMIMMAYTYTDTDSDDLVRITVAVSQLKFPAEIEKRIRDKVCDRNQIPAWAVCQLF